MANPRPVGVRAMSMREISKHRATLDRPLALQVSQDRARWFALHILPHEAKLRGWLRRRRLDAREIDDVVQETYAILTSRPRLDDLIYPKAYLFRTAQSVVLQDARRSRIVPFEPLEGLEQGDAVHDWLTPERIAMDRQELKEVVAAIHAMPARVGAAFMLRRIEGLSQRDIAARMGISESTVEKHLAKGVEMLVHRLGCGGNPSSKSSKGKGLGKLKLVRRPRASADD